MSTTMNRTPDELIAAMEFCLLDGGASAFLIGDNEMARLVLEWRELKSATELAFARGKLEGINAAREVLGAAP